MQDNRRQQLGLRLDPATMERLEALSRKTGTPITTLGREILQSALRDDSQAEQTALLETTITQLERLEHNVAQILPALHQRLGTLEQLVCAVDANAIRRAPVEHMKLRHLWRNTRYALFELQGICCHLLQQTMHTNGHKLAEIEARYAQFLQEAENVMAEFVPEIRTLMAQLDADAPPPLQPPPPPQLPPILLPPRASSGGEDEAPIPANIPTDGPAEDAAAPAGQPAEEQPGLFAGHGAPPAANGAANGSTEVAR